uniref:B box-type domain-containing protein n=1 Tax=Poecilia latipinna TaxID=48699 RepID=A0A3B3V6X2_9TELE
MAASGLPPEDQLRCQICKNIFTFPVTLPCDISCDECTGLKLKAVKSCLVCLASYCETHLKPHLMTKGLKKHQLLDPVENLEARMCSYHNKPLELFCRTDQTFTCMLCTLLDHKEHDYLPLSEEAEQKRSVLRGTEETLNRMIQERRGKMQDLRHTSRLNQEAADGKAAVGLQVFTDLKQNLQTGLDELLKNIEIKQVTAERLTERLIAELGQEVKVLMQSSADVQVLSSSADHAHVLRKMKTNILRKLKITATIHDDNSVFMGQNKKTNTWMKNRS